MPRLHDVRVPGRVTADAQRQDQYARALTSPATTNGTFMLRLAFGFCFAIALLSLPMWSEPMRAPSRPPILSTILSLHSQNSDKAKYASHRRRARDRGTRDCNR
jgi:hypothetical protein